MTELLLALNENLQSQTKMIEGVKEILSDLDSLIEKFQKENAALKKALKIS